MSNRVYVLHIEAQILGVFITRKAAEAKRDALYSTDDCKITPTTLYGIELR
jgi:hypothetical protein